MAKTVLWAALPHYLRSDPKSISVSDQAFRALVEAVLWCSENKTDGVLTRGYIGRIMSNAIADELREAGLLDGHGVITFFLDVNRSKHERQVAEDAGKAGAKARWDAERNADRIPDRNAEYRDHILDMERGENKPKEAPSEPAPAAPTPEVSRETESKPKKASREETHPNRKDVIDIIDRIYLEATGHKPNWQDGKNRAVAQSLAKAYALDEIEARARRFWIERLPSFAWNGKLTVLSVGDFRAHFERLAVAKSHANGFHDDSIQYATHDLFGEPIKR